MAHTKGPWTIQNQAIVGVRSDGSGQPLAIGGLFVPYDDGMRYDMQEANGKLIAAAPELLEALRIAKQIIDRHVTKEKIAGYSNIETAINRAEGRI